MERAIAPDPGDEFGLSKLSDDDLNRLLHDILSHIVANEQGLFTPEEAGGSRVKLAELEARIWDEASYLDLCREASG